MLDRAALVVVPTGFLLGALLLCWLVRSWQGEPRRRSCALYVLLTLLFHSGALLSPGHQVATDVVYQERPFAGLIEETERGARRARNPLLADPPLMMLPFRHLVRESLLRGELPLWSHQLGTGQPLLGNGQSATFGPLQLLSLPFPVLDGMALVAGWQMLLSLLFVHALLRRMRCSETAAVLAALAFAWSSFAVFWAYYPLATTTTFLPAIALGIHSCAAAKTAAQAKRETLWLTAVATSLLLSGHPESAVHAVLLSLFVALAMLLASDNGSDRRRLVAMLAAATVLTASLTAPLLVASFEALDESLRRANVQERAEVVMPPPLRASSLALLVNPLTYGSPRDGNYKGPWNLNEASAWAGLLPLVLALTGAIFERRIRHLLVGGCLCLLVALRAPPFGELAALVPVLGEVPNGRLRVLYLLAMAAAAGPALDRLLPPGKRSTSAMRLVLAAVALVAVSVFALLHTPDVLAQRTWWWVTLVGATATCVGALLARGGRSTTLVRFFVCCALGLDLFLLGGRYNPVLPADRDLSTRPEAVSFLEKEALMAGRPVRVLAEGYEMYPNVAALYGLSDVRVLDPAQPELAARFVEEHLAGGDGPRAPWVYVEARDRGPGVHTYLGVQYRLTRHRRQLAPPWRLAFRGGGGKVWSLDGSQPWFFFPARVERVDSLPDAREAVTRISDWAAHAVIEAPPVHADLRTASRPSADQTAVLRNWQPVSNGFELELDAPTGGVLASAVSWAPGWRVGSWHDSGDQAPSVIRVNGAFLGVQVPPGVEKIELRYRPRGFGVSLAVAGIGAVLFLLLLRGAIRTDIETRALEATVVLFRCSGLRLRSR